MFSVFVDVDSNKRGPTSRPVIGTEIQKDCNFEAHVYYLAIVWALCLVAGICSYLNFRIAIRCSFVGISSCLVILVASYTKIFGALSRHHQASQPNALNMVRSIQKGTTQCSVGAVKFNCLLCTIFYIDHSLWCAMSEWHQNWGNSNCLGVL